MFKGHPKGLYVAFFANLGERFSFYIMMACLVFFLQAKFGLAEDKAGNVYGLFYFLTYALALVGGFIADKTQNYKRTIFMGILIMLILAISLHLSPCSQSLSGMAFSRETFRP